MTWLTGKSRKKKNSAFTLLEIMVAVAVLSLGVVMIYQSYFTIAHAYSYGCHFVAVNGFIEEKLWTAEETISNKGDLSDQPQEGQIQIQEKNYNWSLTYIPLESHPDSGLFKLTLQVDWKEGRRNVGISRTVYAFYKKKE